VEAIGAEALSVRSDHVCGIGDAALEGVGRGHMGDNRNICHDGKHRGGSMGRRGSGLRFAERVDILAIRPGLRICPRLERGGMKPTAAGWISSSTPAIRYSSAGSLKNSRSFAVIRITFADPRVG
jgi:hypothetical protein